jgi:hypothetical protein
MMMIVVAMMLMIGGRVCRVTFQAVDTVADGQEEEKQNCQRQDGGSNRSCWGVVSTIALCSYADGAD